MEHLVVKESRQKMLALLVVFVVGLFFLLWVAAELRSVGTGFLHIVVGIGLFLYAAFVVLLAYRALCPGERIVIDETGVGLRGVGVIRWQDIESACVRRSGGQNVLCLTVRNEDVYVRQVKGPGRLAVELNRKAGLTPFALTTTGTDCEFDRLTAVVSQRTMVERIV